MIAAAMGWIGTVGTISAYVMLSRGHWHSASLRYAALNGLGGLLAAVASAAYGAWPSVASNLLWSAVAVHSAVTTLHGRRTHRLSAVESLPDRGSAQVDQSLAPHPAHPQLLSAA